MVPNSCTTLTDAQLIEYRKLMKEMNSKSLRNQSIKAAGKDNKHAYHVVRLVDQAFMALQECELDLERNHEKLKAVRNGEWSLKEIEDYFKRRENELDTAYENSKLPHEPDEKKIRNLLAECLEQHFGSLSGCLVQPELADLAMEDIREVLRKYDRARSA